MSTGVEILYLAKGRRAYTEYTLQHLFTSTNWDLVDRLVVYDDGSSRDDAKWLKKNAYYCPGDVVFRQTLLGSPVAVMNHYLDRTQSQIFAKIDNDIMVPPGWLDTMLGVMERNRSLELLGMEPGRGCHSPEESWVGMHTSYPASHIGGVGLMRTSAFDKHPRPVADGYFGFTEWQHTYNPALGWIRPDLRVFALNQIPFEPWRTIGEGYLKAKIQRFVNDIYPPEWSYYWDWAMGEEDAA